MTWDEAHGNVSRAFDEWRTADRDIRVFLEWSRLWSAESYARFWEIAKAAADADPERGSDVLDRLFPPLEEATKGLMQWDYEWMLLAAVVKDAVTAYEVYVEKAADEVLELHKVRIIRNRGRQSPEWDFLKGVHEALGRKVEPKSIAKILRLRHLLTHQRGELRTPEERARFGQPDPEPPATIVADEDLAEWYHDNPPDDRLLLTPEQVESILDTISSRVRRIDPRIYQLSQTPTLPDEVQLRLRRFRGEPTTDVQ